MELILHIGTGKTGSTSIQSILKSQSGNAESQGVFYTGYMFDLLSDKKFSWQKNSGTEEFNKLPAEQRKQELEAVLLSAKEEALEKKCDKIIWSNEALCNMPHVAAIIESVWDAEVTIIAYVRRNDNYALSAYNQWGLKHKIYQGELLSFRQFINKFPLTFYERLSHWQKTGWQFNLFNYHNWPNVVDHFLNFIQLSLSIEQDDERQNSDNPLAFLLLKALVNTSTTIPSLQENFSIDRNMTIRDAEWFFQKLPTPEDVLDVFESTAEDRHKLNLLLDEKERFTEKPPSYSPYTLEDVKAAFSSVLSILVDKVIKNDETWNKQYATNESTAQLKGKVYSLEDYIGVLAQRLSKQEKIIGSKRPQAEMIGMRSEITRLEKANLDLKSELQALHKEVIAHNAILTQLTKNNLLKRILLKVKRVIKV